MPSTRIIGLVGLVLLIAGFVLDRWSVAFVPAMTPVILKGLGGLGILISAGATWRAAYRPHDSAVPGLKSLNFHSWLVAIPIILAIIFVAGAGWVAHESHGNSPAILPLAIGFVICVVIVGAVAINNSTQWLDKYGSSLNRRSKDRY